MFLKHKTNGHLVEILNLEDLFNPMHDTVQGRYHYGEEMQEPEAFTKTDLQFLSDEALPNCWLDAHYRDHEVYRSR